MIQSGGVLVKTPSVTVWQGRTDTWTLDLGFRWASYGSIYQCQHWPKTLVSKRALAVARLPLKVYERNGQDRPEAADPYTDLLRRPSKKLDPFLFWMWTVSTLDIYGEAFWGKVRDRGGRPVELVPLHPTAVHSEDREGRTEWRFDNGKKRIDNIDRRDLVHFRYYHPDSDRGLSPLEPLRSTLENEEGARRANSALWRNGGRPSVLLRHPRQLSDDASKRLVAQWSQLHAGVDNWAKAAILEEGMEAQTLSLNAEELQYVEARKLNREEVCAAYDVPPPVVHILDRATFSNITEQMRSMYRDTMAPLLKLIESTLEFELRDGSYGDGPADFSDSVYAEFLMDEVLRGDFEVRAEAYQKAIYAGWMTPAEVRKKENLPFIEGSDQLIVNASIIPLDAVSVFEPQALPAVPPATGTNTGARWMQTKSGLSMDRARSVLGKLSRPATLADVDMGGLLDGLNGESPLVEAEVLAALAAGESVADLRRRILRLAGKES